MDMPTSAAQKTWLKSILLVVITLSCVYLATLVYAPYPFQFLLKATPILILSAASWLLLTGQIRLLLTLALIFSAIGDVFLAPSEFYHFVFGLASFLIAQIIYTVIFYRANQGKPYSHAIKLFCGTLILYAVVMAVYLLPNTGDLLIPVTVYLIVICFMGVFALLSCMHKLAKLGALTFVCSDSILALGLFVKPLPANDFFVMLTYYSAQVLLVMGFVMSKQYTEKIEEKLA